MKHGISLILVLTIVAFLCATTPVNCQETASSSAEANSTGLPDAPSTTQASTCTNKGKPCPEWLGKWIGWYPPLPESKLQPRRDPSRVGFCTYRRFQDPPLRTNKQVFQSKLFDATHIGGLIAMIVACRSKRSKEEWGSAAPAVAALFGMDYLQFRFVGGPNAIAPAVYEMIYYSRESTR